MTSTAIQLDKVSKAYPVFRRPLDGLRYLWTSFRCGYPKIPDDNRPVWALSEIGLTVRRGEKIGLIGRNGAGKSTLLKLLASGSPPTSGQVRIDGELYSLMPGSVLFSPMLSARENARNYLEMLGLKKAKVAECIDDIEKFTELGSYFDQPVRTYSLGMRVRAEFAVATAHTADVVIIDEVLGAGDVYWARKMAERMDQRCGEGTTLLLVSHSIGQIARFCDRVVWIEQGRIIMDGPTLEVTRRYEGFLERLSWQTSDVDDKTIDVGRVLPNLGTVTLPESGQSVVRWPSRGEILIDGVWLNGRAVTDLEVQQDADVAVRISARAQEAISCELVFLLTLWTRDGVCFAVGENEPISAELRPGQGIGAEFSFAAMQLCPGEYFMTLTLHDARKHTLNERHLRLDVLYKSFRIVAHCDRSSLLEPPVFRSSFDLENGGR